GKLADFLLLIAALEIEARDIGARGNFAPTDRKHVEAAGYFLPNGFLAVEVVARLIDETEFDAFTNGDGAVVGFFLAGDHFEQGRLAGAVWPDDAYDATGRQLEAEPVD